MVNILRLTIVKATRFPVQERISFNIYKDRLYQNLKAGCIISSSFFKIPIAFAWIRHFATTEIICVKISSICFVFSIKYSPTFFELSVKFALGRAPPNNDPGAISIKIHFGSFIPTNEHNPRYPSSIYPYYFSLKSLRSWSLLPNSSSVAIFKKSSCRPSTRSTLKYAPSETLPSPILLFTLPFLCLQNDFYGKDTIILEPPSQFIYYSRRISNSIISFSIILILVAMDVLKRRSWSSFLNWI